MSAPATELEMWVIYERTSDFPNSCVVRIHKLLEDGTTVPEGGLPCLIAPSIERIHEVLPKNLVKIQSRGEDPDPCIVEVWV